VSVILEVLRYSPHHGFPVVSLGAQRVKRALEIDLFRSQKRPTNYFTYTRRAGGRARCGVQILKSQSSIGALCSKYTRALTFENFFLMYQIPPRAHEVGRTVGERQGRRG
jgi:hypothetical protein